MTLPSANLNVGILGHVDCGKTSLSRALSQVASTCAFDKHPESQQRKITLDLGFSAFRTALDEEKKEELLVTLVDCPGHASLMKTVLSGALIIDTIVLVIDVTKGIQTQTSECIVIGEIICPNSKLIVVLNKIDLIPEAKRNEKLRKMKEALVSKVFSQTNFSQVEIVSASATLGVGVEECVSSILEAFRAQQPELEARRAALARKPLLFPVDHCFPIQGKGTVMTGTVLQGSISLGDSVFICGARETRKVKSINVFKQSVKRATTGDRCGILLTEFKSSRIERGYITSSSETVVHTVDHLIARVQKVRFFTAALPSRTKLHITLGHGTSMGKVVFFSRPKKSTSDADQPSFSTPNTLHHLHASSFRFEEELPTKADPHREYYAKIDLETPLQCYADAVLLGSRLDTDFNVHQKMCRIAFHGVLQQIDLRESSAQEPSLCIDPSNLDELLRVYRYKQKKGYIDSNPKILSKTMKPDLLIGMGLVSKEALQRYKDKKVKQHPIQPFINRRVKVVLSEKEDEGESAVFGRISGSFGKSGKYHIQLDKPLPEKYLLCGSEDIGGSGVKLKGGESVVLDYKVNVFSKDRLWEQDDAQGK